MKFLHNLQWYDPKARESNSLYKIRKAHSYNSLQSAVYNASYNIFTDIPCSLLLLQYTQRNVGSRLTFILALLSFCHFLLFLGTSDSNGNCLYLGAAVVVNAVPFFLLWGAWPGDAFIWGHWIGVARVGRVVRMTFIKDYQIKGARFNDYVIWVPSWYCHYTSRGRRSAF